MMQLFNDGWQFAKGGERITGNKTVTLIFLPGSSMDLSWFQFTE